MTSFTRLFSNQSHDVWSGPQAGLAAAILGTSLLMATMTMHGQSEPRPATSQLPVRGLHLSAPSKKDLPAALEFIRKSLPKEGVNTLILEFDYHYDFQSRPEFGDPTALGKSEVQQLAKACRENGIELIPQINCLGHQSWAARTDRLLTQHPEFDETPGKYPQNKGIYCRSYCPLHPGLHAVLFDLIDELAKACDAKAFHVGMDEIFILADPDCPRCHGKVPAELLAGEVRTLHDHLAKIGCRMWMWGDRFIDGKATRLGKWEASENGTYPAVDHVPKDIVICDWHYNQAPETPQYFVEKGFDVVECPWRKTAVALGELTHIRTIRAGKDESQARRALGMVETTWCGFGPFLQAYRDQASGQQPSNNAASQSAACFVALSKAMQGRH